MTTYSIRCRDGYCRHRRVSRIHPEDYKVIPRCSSCKQRKGWRIEQRSYNQKDLCTCGQSPLYPHRKGKYKFCDFHPEGFRNQAKRFGATDAELDRPLAFEDTPLETLGVEMKETDDCPF